RGLAMIVWSSLASAGYALLAALGLVASTAAKSFRVGSGATQASTSFSLALIGVGHLVGLAVGAAMFVGLLISWAYLVPHYTSLAGAIPVGTSLNDFIGDIFVHRVRFIGAGTIGVA